MSPVENPLDEPVGISDWLITHQAFHPRIYVKNAQQHYFVTIDKLQPSVAAKANSFAGKLYLDAGFAVLTLTYVVFEYEIKRLASYQISLPIVFISVI